GTAAYLAAVVGSPAIGGRYVVPILRRWARQQPQPLASINRVAQRLPPGPIIKVPAHRLGQAGIEGFNGPPTQFAFQFARVDGVPSGVARAVGHEGYEPS